MQIHGWITDLSETKLCFLFCILFVFLNLQKRSFSLAWGCCALWKLFSAVKSKGMMVLLSSRSYLKLLYTVPVLYELLNRWGKQISNRLTKCWAVLINLLINDNDIRWGVGVIRNREGTKGQSNLVGSAKPDRRGSLCSNIFPIWLLLPQYIFNNEQEQG